MVRRPHRRAFPRPVTAPHCVAVAAARTPVAATPIVARELNTRAHERPRSFRKGLVDVFVPSEARVSKKKQKLRERRRKHAQQAQSERHRTGDNRVPLCTYGTFVDTASPRPPCVPPLRPPQQAQKEHTALTEVSLDDDNDTAHDDRDDDDDYDILCAADVLDGPLVHAPASEAQCIIC